MKSLVIKKDDLIYNIEKISEKTDSKIIAVLKANGYGLSLMPYAEILLQKGINFFAVTDISDAICLKNHYKDAIDVLCLTGTEVLEDIKILAENDIIITLSSENVCNLINQVAKTEQKVKVHIKIDTGMSRFGFTQINELENVLNNSENIEITGIYTHFHSVLDRKKVDKQMKKFNDFLSYFKDVNFGQIHVCNSYATLKYKDLHFNTVRVGSAFLGRVSGNFGLKKIGQLKSEIISIKVVKKGESVGYSGAFKVKKDTKVAIVPLGSYDGLHVFRDRDIYRFSDILRYIYADIKSLNRKLFVEINGEKARILGHIGLNNVVIDISNIQAEISDTVLFNTGILNINERIEREYV